MKNIFYQAQLYYFLPLNRLYLMNYFNLLPLKIYSAYQFNLEFINDWPKNKNYKMIFVFSLFYDVKVSFVKIVFVFLWFIKQMIYFQEVDLIVLKLYPLLKLIFYFKM
jgi:hypothetical protein